MSINRVKMFLAALMALSLLSFAVLNTGEVGTRAQTTQNTQNQNKSNQNTSNQNTSNQNTAGSQDADVAAIYKSKCAACHTAKATKWFEQSKMDDVHVEIILKGKKGEKPPHMPSYEDKGITAAQAKLLVAYMRQISAPAKE